MEIRSITTEAVEVCPHCECENVFANWDVSTRGYVAKCWNCGREIFLCDECMHSDDNPGRKCDWHQRGKIGCCFRGTTE